MTCGCGERKFIDLESNNPYVQTEAFMNPIYLQVSIKSLSSQDSRYWFIIIAMPLKPITKIPTADYE